MDTFPSSSDVNAGKVQIDATQSANACLEIAKIMWSSCPAIMPSGARGVLTPFSRHNLHALPLPRNFKPRPLPKIGGDASL